MDNSWICECGQQNDDEANFCKRCGRRRPENAAAEEIMPAIRIEENKEVLSGESVIYKKKIQSAGTIESIRCPSCNSTNLTYNVERDKAGFSGTNACCGWIIAGPIGILCGTCGMNNATETEYWICNNCGRRLDNESLNSTKNETRKNAMIISNTPDYITDNIEQLLAESNSEMEELINRKKNEYNRQRSIHKELKVYDTACPIGVFVLFAASVIALIASGIKMAVILFILCICVLCISVVFREKLEDKYADREYLEVRDKLKKAVERNKKLNEIKKAKDDLKAKGII